MPGIDSYTKLLLHCDGDDGATIFIDSATGKSVTRQGTAQVDTAQSKFGGASLLVDGNSDYLTIPTSADFCFGDGNFTIDFWIRWAAFPGNNVAMPIMGSGTSTGNEWVCWLYNQASTFYKFSFYVVGSAVSLVMSEQPFAADMSFPSLNVWYHMAIVRNGNNYLLFCNGTQLGSTVTDTSTHPDFGAALEIGRNTFNVTGYHNGWLDEVRVSKGIARWAANFTPPTCAYSKPAGNFSGGGAPWVF